MKKYNLSKIMKRAWELVKKVGMTISSGLKKAWEEAKSMTQTMYENVMAEIESIISEASDCCDYAVKENVWEKYGKSRTYLKVVETRNHSKHYAEYDFGYIDNNTNEYHAGKHDAFGRYTLGGYARTGR